MMVSRAFLVRSPKPVSCAEAVVIFPLLIWQGARGWKAPRTAACLDHRGLRPSRVSPAPYAWRNSQALEKFSAKVSKVWKKRQFHFQSLETGVAA